VDDQSLATMIVGTARAFGVQTQRALPTAAATATARSTSIAAFPPTAIIGSTPAATQPAAQSTLTRNDNGSTAFVDDLGGYHLVVPAGWLAVRVNQSEYFAALDALETAEPEVQKALAGILDDDPVVTRLFALDMQPDHVENGIVSTISVQWNAANAMSLATDADLQKEADLLRSQIAKMEVLPVEVQLSPAGIQHGLITARWQQQAAGGESVGVFQKQAFLRFGPGRVVITLFTTDRLKDALLPAFDAMIAGVGLSLPE
jgi:hypothetical protein